MMRNVAAHSGWSHSSATGMPYLVLLTGQDVSRRLQSPLPVVEYVAAVLLEREKAVPHSV